MRLQVGNHASQPIGLRAGCPPLVTGHLTGDNRYEGALRGNDGMNQRQQIRARISFDVELDAPWRMGEDLRNLVHVGRRDVTPVRAGVYGDALHACLEAHLHGLEYRRRCAAAGVPERRHLVDVHAQSNHLTPISRWTTSAIS